MSQLNGLATTLGGYSAMSTADSSSVYVPSLFRIGVIVKRKSSNPFSWFVLAYAHSHILCRTT